MVNDGPIESQRVSSEIYDAAKPRRLKPIVPPRENFYSKSPRPDLPSKPYHMLNRKERLKLIEDRNHNTLPRSKSNLKN